MKNIIYLFIIVLLGCSKGEQPTPLTSPELLWKSPLSIDAYVGSMKPLIYKDIVVYSKNHTGTIEKNEIIAYNKNTGQEVWRWQDFILLGSEVLPSSWDEIYIYHNVFIFSSGRAVYAIDLDTGQTLWKNQYEQIGDPYVYGYENKIFHVQHPVGDAYYDIIMADITDGKWRKVYRIEKEHNLRPDVHVPKVYVNIEGDTILTFNHSTYNINIQDGNVFMAFYNLSEDSLISSNVRL